MTGGGFARRSPVLPRPRPAAEYSLPAGVTRPSTSPLGNPPRPVRSGRLRRRLPPPSRFFSWLGATPFLVRVDSPLGSTLVSQARRPCSLRRESDGLLPGCRPIPPSASRAVTRMARLAVFCYTCVPGSLNRSPRRAFVPSGQVRQILSARPPRTRCRSAGMRLWLPPAVRPRRLIPSAASAVCVGAQPVSVRLGFRRGRAVKGPVPFPTDVPSIRSACHL